MWIYIPSTLCRSAQESEASTSDLNLQQTERLARSVSLNGKLSRPQSWRRAWKKKPWLRVLSGATLEPSTASRGVESWISSLADIRASRSAPPESVLERTMLATYGQRSLESLKRRNAASSSSRMSQVISHWDSPKFSEIWKEWVSDIRQACLRRRKSAQVIDANECLFSVSETSEWATPRTITGGAESQQRKQELGRKRSGGGDLQAQTQAWPTPCSTDHCGSAKLGQRRGQLSEATEVNFQISHQAQETSTHGEESSSNIPNWPQRSQNWQTPAACDGEGGTLEIREGANGKYKLGDQVGSRKRLNPIFTEWMMGWPLGWTDFARVEMESCHWWRRMRSRLFLLVSENKS